MSVFLADFPPNLGSEVAAGQHYMMIDSYKSRNATAAGGIGDHSTGELYKELDTALDQLVDAEDRLDIIRSLLKPFRPTAGP